LSDLVTMEMNRRTNVSCIKMKGVGLYDGMSVVLDAYLSSDVAVGEEELPFPEVSAITARCDNPCLSEFIFVSNDPDGAVVEFHPVVALSTVEELHRASLEYVFIDHITYEDKHYIRFFDSAEDHAIYQAQVHRLIDDHIEVMLLGDDDDREMWLRDFRRMSNFQEEKTDPLLSRMVSMVMDKLGLSGDDRIELPEPIEGNVVATNHGHVCFANWFCQHFKYIEDFLPLFVAEKKYCYVQRSVKQDVGVSMCENPECLCRNHFFSDFFPLWLWC
jgi:hypothetical protein